uniref:Uncharacterized protein n=2 Tax=unclassified Caudoviricetes TaxID=2788787 RepID=A0A8S5LJZ6_9CAUD|nr:MAG TPA: hypothetical protein [Siphoviridae sp. ctXPh6]DAF53367.1 MAG TPA: hypothetical protein [Siphoviridae sp. ctkyE7]
MLKSGAVCGAISPIFCSTLPFLALFSLTNKSARHIDFID